MSKREEKNEKLGGKENIRKMEGKSKKRGDHREGKEFWGGRKA